MAVRGWNVRGKSLYPEHDVSHVVGCRSLVRCGTAEDIETLAGSYRSKYAQNHDTGAGSADL